MTTVGLDRGTGVIFVNGDQCGRISSSTSLAGAVEVGKKRFTYLATETLERGAGPGYTLELSSERGQCYLAYAVHDRYYRCDIPVIGACFYSGETLTADNREISRTSWGPNQLTVTFENTDADEDCMAAAVLLLVDALFGAREGPFGKSVT